MEMQFCHICGGKLKEGAKFCGTCGSARLPMPEAPASNDQPEYVPMDTADDAAIVVDDAPQAEPEAAPPAQQEVAVEALAAEPAPEPEPEAAAQPQPPEPEPVVSAAPEASTAPAPKTKKSPYPRRGAGRTILAIVLCLFIFIWSFVGLVIYNVRNVTSGEVLTDSLDTMLEDADIVNMPASQLIPDVEDSDMSLVDWAIQEISDNYDGTVEASKKDIEKFLEESTFSDFVTQKLGDFMNDLYTGSSDFEISADEIQELLEDNAEIIEEVFDTPLLQEDIEAFVEELEDKQILEAIEIDTLKEDMAPVYYGVQIGLSYWVIGFFGVLTLLFIVLLLMANRWSLLRTCGDTGITWTVLGCLLCLPALVTMIVPDLWSNLLQGIPIVDSLISSVLRSTLLPAAILLGVGILLIVIKIVGKAIVLKSAKKKQI